MGLFSRIFGTPHRNGPALPADDRSQRVRPIARVYVGAGSPLATVTGTTTFCAAEAQSMMRRHGQGEQGYLEVPARLALQWVPKLEADCVAVMVEGEAIGFLSLADAKSVDVRRLESATIHVQAFSEVVNGKLRVEAWVWLAGTRPEWKWSRTARPPMTSSAKAQHRHAEASRNLRHRERSGQTSEVAAGRVNGVHYLELVEPIKEAKRRGDLDLALELCYAAIQGAEGDRMGGLPAPAYTEHAAIVLRKMGRFSEEVAVLERYLRFVAPADRPGHPFTVRAAKARAKMNA